MRRIGTIMLALALAISVAVGLQPAASVDAATCNGSNQFVGHNPPGPPKHDANVCTK
jgi:hypothetical protein